VLSMGMQHAWNVSPYKDRLLMHSAYGRQLTRAGNRCPHLPKVALVSSEVLHMLVCLQNSSLHRGTAGVIGVQKHTVASSSESKESLRSTRDPRGVRPRRRLADALRDSFRMLSRSVFFSFSSLSFTVPMSSLGSAMLARLCSLLADAAAATAAEVRCALRVPRLQKICGQWAHHQQRDDAPCHAISGLPLRPRLIVRVGSVQRAACYSEVGAAIIQTYEPADNQVKPP
jgi:hypothetical protein